MERLGPLDAYFLDLEDEDPHASLAIASVAVVDGPVPTHAEFVAAIRGRMPLVRRYRQRVVTVPFDIGRPVWVDDPDVDLDFHVRRTALPAPGDDAALERVVARVMAHRLDRARPLWEYWVIEGLAEGRWALLSKVHHCMVDGVSGNDLYRVVFDTTPEPASAVRDDWRPGPAPDTVDLLVDACGQLLRCPYDQIRLLAHALAAPGPLRHGLLDAARGLAALVTALSPAERTALSGPIGGARRYAVSRVPIADLKAVAKAHDVTLNDVYLAAVAGAFRDLLLRRGEEPRAGSVRSLVPVNVRVPGAEMTLDNRVSMLLPMLPVEYADPVERLRVAHGRVERLKASGESEIGATLTQLAALEPYPPLSLGLRLTLHLPQRWVTTVTTNVPGPRERVYILGRPIREILPYVPIADRLRIGVSLLTYDGTAAFGVTTDFTAVPDARQFADAIAGEIRTLVPSGATRAKRTAASRKESPDVQPRRHPARVGRGPAR
jgi:diacylglycerol O-acyltransferase